MAAIRTVRIYVWAYGTYWINRLIRGFWTFIETVRDVCTRDGRELRRIQRRAWAKHPGVFTAWKPRTRVFIDGQDATDRQVEMADTERGACVAFLPRGHLIALERSGNLKRIILRGRVEIRDQ